MEVAEDNALVNNPKLKGARLLDPAEA